jgi:hypothetical protein
LNLKEVEILFKEIIEKVPNVNGSHFIIFVDPADTRFAQGYQIAIRDCPKNIDAKKLKEIARNRNLAVVEGKESIILYTESSRSPMRQK